MGTPEHHKSFMSKDKTVQYVVENSLRMTAVEKELMDETLKHTQFKMMGAPECLQLTANLIRVTKAMKTLDIGVFTGCSALSAALAMPPDGVVHALDQVEDYVKIGRPYFEKAGVSDKIRTHIAPALETLDKFLAEGQSGTFDYAFIDADKVNMINYFERCLLLLRSGGIIAVDNTLWSLSVLDPSDTSESTLTIRKFNKFVKDDPRVNISFLNMGDGLTLLFKK